MQWCGGPRPAPPLPPLLMFHECRQKCIISGNAFLEGGGGCGGPGDPERPGPTWPGPAHSDRARPVVGGVGVGVSGGPWHPGWGPGDPDQQHLADPGKHMPGDSRRRCLATGHTRFAGPKCYAGFPGEAWQ